MQPDARVPLQPGADLGVLVAAVVVAHGVEFLARVGLGDLFEEPQELLVPMPRLCQCVTLPVAISSAANSVVVPCRMWL